jgi:PAS domain S-box-containing protein
VELSGLPVYDRDRMFLGYRGFGVCRDVERIMALRGRSDLPVDSGPMGIPATDYQSTKPREETAPAFAAANVVPFRTNASGTEHRAGGLIQHHALREFARQLNARFQESETEHAGDEAVEEPRDDRPQTASEAASPQTPNRANERRDAYAYALTEHPLLERLPVGILVYRHEHLLYANRAFLESTGYASLDALTEAGGLDSLFLESGAGSLGEADGPVKPLAITTRQGGKIPVEGRLFAVPWNGEVALVLMLASAQSDENDNRDAQLRDAQLRDAQEAHLAATTALSAARAEIDTLNAILEVAADGIVMLNGEGRILSASNSARTLLGYDVDALPGSFEDLLAPDSQMIVLDRVERLAAGATPHEVESSEVTALTAAGTQLSLLLTMRRIDGAERKVCAVIDDLSARKRIEHELADTKRQAQRSLSDKSEFLAKVSHEIRTPLNSIVGFSEVMLEERFGPIGNERYRDYLKDIRASGTQVVSLLDDLIDLSKIEAGKLELSPVELSLNTLVQTCVAEMQPRASRERIIIRMSLAPSLPMIVADPRSLRQIIVNLLANSLRFTAAGGQVIVATALSDVREIVLRVRDTGIGMSDTDVEAALEPFRQLAVRSAWGASGSGLGLALTKRLAEANHARFNIVSRIDDGTLVEIIFPPAP